VGEVEHAVGGEGGGDGIAHKVLIRCSCRTAGDRKGVRGHAGAASLLSSAFTVLGAVTIA
jgi:hypothetical protein